MKLDKYIDQFPRKERSEVRQKIADHCGVSAVTVKSWQNGSRNIKAEYFKSLAEVTDGEVTIFDYHPGLSAA